jgi:acyl carrier protein
MEKYQNAPYGEISSAVINVIADKSSKKSDEIKPECSFSDLGIDSLTSMEIVMAMEEEFGIEIPEEAATNITTVQAAIDFAAQKCNAKTE